MLDVMCGVLISYARGCGKGGEGQGRKGEKI